jgi:adenosine deaminase
MVQAEDIVLTRDLMILEPARGGLREYFRPWHLIRRLPLTPESFRTIVRQAIAHLRDDNITYAELRHSVVHVAAENGFTVHETLHVLLDELEKASVAFDLDARLIVSLVRHEFLPDRTEELLEALDRERDNPRLVGIDLAGDEEHPFDAEWERIVLVANQELDLSVSIHAGETGRGENIRWAIETCRATRVGHGLAAGQDRALLDLIRERNVCVEVCLTSNYLTQWVPDLSQHPIRAFIEHDVPFVLCSDNPQMHGKGLTAEYQLFEELFDRRDLLELMYERQQAFSFAKIGV